jgi:hypothetical protein
VAKKESKEHGTEKGRSGSRAPDREEEKSRGGESGSAGGRGETRKGAAGE